MLTSNELQTLLNLFNKTDSNGTAKPQALQLCEHFSEDNVCIRCGAFTNQLLISSCFPGTLKLTSRDDSFQLPDWVNSETRIATFDLFGHLKINQVRKQKKKIILHTCLLYTCSKYYSAYILNFYNHFSTYDLKPKELLLGINMVEKLLPRYKNIYNFDFKFHELCLALVEFEKQNYIKKLAKMHIYLDNCYNKLRVKSIAQACLYILKENYNTPLDLKNIKKPNCFTLIKQELFSQCIAVNIKTHILCLKNIIGCHTKKISVIILDHDKQVELTLEPFTLKINGLLVDKETISFSAWEPFFSRNLFHPNGNIYNARLNLYDFINVPKLSLGLLGLE